MTHANTFMIGDTLTGMQTLDELGLPDADASYRPFAAVDILGDGSGEGNGAPVVSWHWAALGPGMADILASFLDGDISGYVFIRTRLNRLNVTNDDYQWMTFEGWLHWAEGDESVPALHSLDLTLTFTGLIAHAEYPVS